MVDQAINRHSSMDVTLESQTQLVSRIGLATKNSNKLSFLHGETGVGKSHVANLLQQNLSNVHTVKLQLKNILEPEQLKQQIVCELATDELSDLNQPISTAVYNNIRQKNISTLLIIDNAEMLPQQTLSALWQSIHELTRMNQTHFTFNVLLLGASRWALPLYSGLKNKTESLVAEFPLTPLTKQQATDFMMSVHADWSDFKIQQFINKVPADYLTPKQLIYAQVPSSGTHKKKIALAIALVVMLFISIAIVGSLESDIESKTVDTQELPASITLPPAATVLPQSNEVILESDSSEIALEPVLETNDQFDKLLAIDSLEENVLSNEVFNAVHSQEDTNKAKFVSNENVELDNVGTEIVDDVPAIEIQTIPAPSQVKPAQELIEPPVTSNYKYDEQYLLSVSVDSYALMLGGYSKQLTLAAMQARFEEQSMVYQYQTVRNQQPWFVLLYGVFDSFEQANLFVNENQAVFTNFSPWAKPIRSIQQEIEVNQ